MSSADPLLREQQKLKELLAKSRRDAQLKKEKLEKAQAEANAAKEEQKRTRRMRGEEKKRWQDDMETMRQELAGQQQLHEQIGAQVDAMSSQVRQLQTEAASWEEKAAEERSLKQGLQQQLDELSAEGMAAVAAEFGGADTTGSNGFAYDLKNAVEDAVRDWQPAPKGGRDLSSRERLVETLARTTVMTRQLRSLASEVEAASNPPELQRLLSGSVAMGDGFLAYGSGDITLTADGFEEGRPPVQTRGQPEERQQHGGVGAARRGGDISRKMTALAKEFPHKEWVEIERTLHECGGHAGRAKGLLRIR